MPGLNFTLTTLTPVIFTKSGGDANTADTLLYAPGSAILGLLASRLIRERKLGAEAHLDTDFSAWFLNGALSVSPAYPQGQSETAKGIAYPAPMSVQRIKDTHSQSCLNTIHLAESELPTDPLQAVGGYIWVRSSDETSNLCCIQPQTTLHFHHGRDSSGEPVPFTYVSLDANQSFAGTIRGSEADLAALRQAVGEQFEATVGRSRSAQYGRVRFQFGPAETLSGYSALRPGDQITLTLQSELILLNTFGFPSPELTTLEQALPGFRIVRQLSQAIRLETHIGVWGLRRPSERALQAGAVFLLEALEAIPGETLQRLSEAGLGERRNEGHGRIAFAYLEEKVKMAKSNRASFDRPSGPPPELICQLLQEGFLHSLDQQIEAKALKKARDFGNKSAHLIPRSSLLGRLESWTRQGNRKVFEKNVTNLRDTAKRQLEKCRSQDKTLLDLLQNLDSLDLNQLLMGHQNKYRQAFTKLSVPLPETALEKQELEAVRLMLIQLRKLRQTGQQKGATHA